MPDTTTGEHAGQAACHEFWRGTGYGPSQHRTASRARPGAQLTRPCGSGPSAVPRSALPHDHQRCARLALAFYRLPPSVEHGGNRAASAGRVAGAWTAPGCWTSSAMPAPSAWTRCSSPDSTASRATPTSRPTSRCSGSTAPLATTPAWWTSAPGRDASRSPPPATAGRVVAVDVAPAMLKHVRRAGGDPPTVEVIRARVPRYQHAGPRRTRVQPARAAPAPELLARHRARPASKQRGHLI
jgi:hypothetical protein